MNRNILTVVLLILMSATTNIQAQQLLMGGTASASATYSGSAAGAFDGDISIGGWMSNKVISSLEYDLPQAQIVTNYSIICGYLQSSSYASYFPKSWNLQGYDGSNWVNIDTVTNYAMKYDVWAHFTVNNTKAYQKYQISFTASSGGGYLYVTELRLYSSSIPNKGYSGNYTIGTTGTFKHIQEAADSLSLYGVTGPVVLKIQSGLYAEQVTVKDIPGASNTNTITFTSLTGNPSDVTWYYTSSGSSDNFVLYVLGASHLNFSKIGFRNASTSSYCDIVWLYGRIQKISFTDNIFTGGNSNSSSATHIYSYGQILDSIDIERNTFVSNYEALYLNSNSSIRSSNIIVRNNTINSNSAVELDYVDTSYTENNTISNAVNDNVIYLYSNGAFSIRNNTVFSNSTNRLLNIYYQNVAVNNRIVANNVFQNNGSGYDNVSISNIDSVKFYNNTVIRNGSNYSAVHFSSCSGVSFANNFIQSSNSVTLQQESTGFKLLDNNNYFTTFPYLIRWNGTSYRTIEEFRVAVAQTNQLSTQINAMVGLSNGHFNSKWLDGTGRMLPEVTTDIMGVIRGSKPDIGAYEFTATTGNALSGNLIVNSVKGPYKTLNAVFDSLMSCGINGKTTVMLEDDAYEEQVVLERVPGSNAQNTITVMSSPKRTTKAAIGYAAAGTADNFVFYSIGLDNICFKKILFYAGSNNYSNGMLFNGYCRNIKVDSCEFQSNSMASSSYKVHIQDAGSFIADTVSITNSLFNNNYDAIKLNSFSFDVQRYNGYIEVINNTMTNQYRTVDLEYSKQIRISKNAFSGFNYEGLYLNYISDFLDVSQNIFKSNDISGNFGVEIDNSGGTFGNKAKIADNVINVKTYNMGMYIYYDNNIDVVGNTISLQSPSYSGNTYVPLYVNNGTNISILNNILYTPAYTNAFNYTTPAGIVASDYNAFYNLASTLGTWGSTSVATLSDLKSIEKSDIHSVFANPSFQSSDTLIPSSSILNNAGLVIANYPNDILGNVRSSTPDIGAYEFTSTGKPLHGTYFIQKDSGNYKTITDAVNALNTLGIDAPVTFKIAGGTYSESMEMFPIAGSSVTDTVVFEAATADSVYLVTDATTKTIGIELLSASNITFQDIHFRVKTTSNAMEAVQMQGACYYINFNRCSFDLDNPINTNGTWAIYGSNTSPYFQNITIQNCKFNNGSRPIYFDCNSGQGNLFTITGNSFNNCGYDAIWLQKINGVYINANSFNGIHQQAVSLNYCNKPIQIMSNTIYNNNNVSNYNFGIYLNNCVGSFISRILVANNMISNSYAQNYYFSGIETTNSQFVDILYNSIFINTQATTTASYAVYASGGNNIRIRNNILSNYHAFGYALYVSTGGIIEACDYNNLYTEGSSKFAYWGADYANLTALKLASSYSVNSISASTSFFSFSDLHTSSKAIVGKAMPLANITTDIDGNPRNATTPDIGADEIYCTAATLDLKIPKICLGSPLVFADSSKNVAPGTKYSWDFQNDGIIDASTLYNANNPSSKPLNYGFFTAGGTSYSQYSDNSPFNAFDGDSINQGWGAYSSGNPVWLQYKGVNPAIVARYTMYCSSLQSGGWSNNSWNPKTWNFQASNDGSTWTNLDVVSNMIIKNDTSYQFSIVNTTSYIYYRIYITDAQNGIANYVRITEFGLYEATGITSKINYKYPSAGNYTLKLKAEQVAGCVDSTTFAVTVDGNVPVANAGADQAICQGLTKTLVASGNGKYSWSTGDTSQQINVKPLTIGAVNYYLTVTASTGCTSVDTVKITVVAPFKYTRPINDTICFGQSATLMVSGAKTYIWNTGKDTANLVVSPTQTTKYTVNISDGNCVIPDSATVTVVSLKASIDSIIPISCYGLCTGYLKAGISNGFAPYNYIWSSNQTSNSISNLCAGSYSVTVKDATGCIDSSKTTLSTPEPLTATFDSKPTQCKVNDGSIKVMMTGGNGGYRYEWKSDTTDTYKALASGNYSVTVVDSKQCRATFSSTVSLLPLPTIQVQSKNVTCFNGNDGSITLNVQSSSGTPTVIWSTTDKGLQLSGLKSGSYTATVTDTAGCSVVVTQSLTEPKQISYSKSLDTMICKNASVTLYATGGSLYKWSINSTNPQITVSPKTATTYKVTVSDGVCFVSDSIKVTINTLAVSTSKQDATCFGRVDGSVSAQVTGGKSPYSYTWNIPAKDSSITMLSGLIPGSYTVTVTDAYNCSLQSTSQVNEPAAIDAALVVQNTGCDSANGYVKVMVSGGTNPYSYLWNTGSVSDSIGSLNAGVYSVAVQDKNGCTVDNSISVNSINAPKVVVETVKMPSCFGLTDGQILISGTGGTGAYKYMWSNGSSTQIITDLAAGSYTVTISDTKLCKSISSIVVNTPQPLTVVPSITNPGCSLSNGNILLNSNGGTKPYTIKWDNGASDLFLQNIPAGVYNATVTDVNTCSKTVQVNVNDINAPKVDVLNVSNISCSGLGGAIYTTISGGTGNLTIAWSNGTGNKDLTGVTQSGFYSIMATDDNNCRGVNGAVIHGSVPKADAGSDKKICAGDSVVLVASGGLTFKWNTGSTVSSIKVSPAVSTKYTVTVSNGTCTNTADVWVYVSNITATVIGKNDATCNGLCNGSATVSATSGATPYNYEWSNGFRSNNGFASDLCAGIQTIVVTDAYSCKAQTTVTIGQPTPILIAFDTTSSDCKKSTGSVKANVKGGTVPYSYYWATGSSDTALQNISSGSYLLRIKDGSGCEASNLATVNDKGSASLVFAKTEPLCFGQANGSINLSISGGQTPYSISWSNGSTSAQITGLQVGPYDVAVADAQGCKSYGIAVLTQPSQLSLNAQVSASTCNGSDGQATLLATGGKANYSYKWNDLDTKTTKLALAAGIYQATVTDANACVAAITFSLGENGAPYVVIDSIKPEHCGQNDGSVFISAISAVGITSYKWSNGSQLSDLSMVGAGNYSVIVSDINNCKSYVAAIVPQAKPVTPQICVVTVGSNLKNLIVWERQAGNSVVSYNIYKETISKDVYQLIGSKSGTQTGVFEDLNSDPLMRSYRYEISVVDQCNNESALSSSHKTMHMTQNVGYGSDRPTVNLIWDEYQGINFGTTNIYRGPSIDSLQLIDAIPAGNFTYRDTPPAGHFFYQVGMQLPYVCDPSTLKSDSGPFSQSLSNMAESQLTDIPVIDATTNLVSISPNPTSDVINVQITAMTGQTYKLCLCDITGQELYVESGIIKPWHISRISLAPYTRSVYFLHVLAGNKVYNQKVIKGN